MKYLRIFLKVLMGLVALIVLLLAFSLTTVDDTPYPQTPYYKQTKQRLDQLVAPGAPKTTLRAGWVKVNLTPSFTTPTGGYGARRGKHWTTVHDSIYVRAIVLDNGSTKVAVVALDLLITPPTVVAELKKRLPAMGLRWENVFVGAIHSHNTLGGWAPGLVGSLISGDYEERIVTHITDRIIQAIAAAQQQLEPVQIGYGRQDASSLVRNRLIDKGPVYGEIQLLKLQKASRPGVAGESAVLCTFAGHATVISSGDYQYLSRDYPGMLVDELEQKTGSFVAFMAGAVGSTAPEAHGDNRFDAVKLYADSLTTRILPALAQIQPRTDSSLAILTLPLTLRDPHARVSDGWRVRPWLFNAVYGDYPAELKALKIGQTVFIGTPCDFSGMLMPELLPLARQKGVNLVVTSFNGGYVGYITPDEYYHLARYETRDMNWFGPQNGAYFTEIMRGLVNKVAP